MINAFEKVYQTHTSANIPWNRNFPHFRLLDFLAEYEISPCAVLDVGCGLGTDSIYLARQGFDVSASDISQTAIFEARLRTQEANVKIEFWVSSALKLPFKDENFDLIFDWRTFHCLLPPEQTRYVNEISRVLKRGGGLLLAAFYLTGFHEEDRKILTEVFEKFPLNEEKMEQIFGIHFRIEFMRIFDMDDKSHCLGGMYYLINSK